MTLREWEWEWERGRRSAPVRNLGRSSGRSWWWGTPSVVRRASSAGLYLVNSRTRTSAPSAPTSSAKVRRIESRRILNRQLDRRRRRHRAAASGQPPGYSLHTRALKISPLGKTHTTFPRIDLDLVKTQPEGVYKRPEPESTHAEANVDDEGAARLRVRMQIWDIAGQVSLKDCGSYAKLRFNV